MLECWNIGKMGFDLQLFEPMTLRGYWTVGLMSIIVCKIQLKLNKIL
jgi:hypothetical protein